MPFHPALGTQTLPVLRSTRSSAASPTSASSEASSLASTDHRRLSPSSSPRRQRLPLAPGRDKQRSDTAKTSALRLQFPPPTECGDLAGRSPTPLDASRCAPSMPRRERSRSARCRRQRRRKSAQARLRRKTSLLSYGEGAAGGPYGQGTFPTLAHKGVLTAG